MAVIQKPNILLLDEHTAALDPKSAAQIARLTTEYIEREGLTALMITHSMKQALNLGDRIIMMHGGRIIDDISGRERNRLTERDLLEKFEKIKKKEKLNKEMIREFRGTYL